MVRESIRAHDDYIYSIAFSPDGQYLATASHDHTVKLVDVASGAFQTLAKDAQFNFWSVAFSSDKQGRLQYRVQAGHTDVGHRPQGTGPSLSGISLTSPDLRIKSRLSLATWTRSRSASKRATSIKKARWEAARLSQGNANIPLPSSVIEESDAALATLE